MNHEKPQIDPEILDIARRHGMLEEVEPGPNSCQCGKCLPFHARCSARRPIGEHENLINKAFESGDLKAVAKLHKQIEKL